MPKVIRMSMKQWSGYMGDLGSRFMPAAQRGVVSGAMRCIPYLIRRTALAAPASPHGKPGAVDTGLYRMAWKSGSLPNGARVFNQRPYSGVVEHGRRPASVNAAGIRNLTAWARRKLHLSPQAAEQAAWAIAKTLEKRPLRARKVLTGDEKGLIEIVEGEILRELTAELEKP